MAKIDKTEAKASIRKALETGKVPKDIGGIKLSKPLRRSAEKLIAEAKKPETLKMIAGGIAMAASAAAAAKAKRDPGVPPTPPAPPPAPGAPGTANGSSDQIADAIAGAARQMFDQFMARKR